METFDVSILEIYDVDGQPQIEVKATAGNNKLGGDDFDDRIIEWLVSEFKRETGIDLSKDNQAMSRLKEAAEKAKIELSGTQSSQINLPFITMKDGNLSTLTLHCLVLDLKISLQSTLRIQWHQLGKP